MKKFVCSVCGYVHEGDSAPEQCPICKVGADKFKEQSGEKSWAAEHIVGVAKGVDQRIIDSLVDEEISIGDYVVTGGEIPACIVIDAVSRLIDGVLADKECHEDESIASGILEYPHYTKPRSFRGLEVPEVLLSGDHKKIADWRLKEAVKITEERRPDLLMLHPELVEAVKPKEKKRKAKK